MTLITNPVEIPDLDQIISLRHLLHQHPELSGAEHQTSQMLRDFLLRYEPDDVIPNLGGTGFALVFESKSQQGPSLLFRAELDALPITEPNEVPYKSSNQGVSHKCGHDGHMAILTGLASLLYHSPLSSGRVILLFQPAEETGAGAWAVLGEPRFQELQPDFVFALHNMPGLPMNQVLVRDKTFAAASVGLSVRLYGKESHAAEPENGLNPGAGMSDLIHAFNGLVNGQGNFADLTLLTVVHARLGEVAFGTNPGFATVMATLRAFEQEDLVCLKQLAVQSIQSVAHHHGLRYELEWVEEFPATVNAPMAVRHIQQAAADLQFELQVSESPVRWSEDFGHFTNRYTGALFGLGAGVSQPHLHHADYDFPDSLIPVGATLFHRIALNITQA